MQDENLSPELAQALRALVIVVELPFLPLLLLLLTSQVLQNLSQSPPLPLQSPHLESPIRFVEGGSHQRPSE